MEGLTILGGKGFIGSQYVKDYYDAAIGNIASVNSREDYTVHSKDVLYFISTTDNQNVYLNPLLDINTNLVTLIKVLENWRLRPDSHDGVFNFISSWFVNSSTKGFYTSTKRCAEELLESYCTAFGLKYRILRLPNVVGPEDKTVSAKKNALQYVIGLLSKDQDVRLRSALREYMHVEDCVRAIDTILARGGVNTVYEVGTGEKKDFASAVAHARRLLNSKSRIIYEEGIDLGAPVTKTEPLRMLGFYPKYSFNEIIHQLVARVRNENPDSNSQR